MLVTGNTFGENNEKRANALDFSYKFHRKPFGIIPFRRIFAA